MKYQVSFSPKNNEKICKTIVCCSGDWTLKGRQMLRWYSLTIKILKIGTPKIITKTSSVVQSVGHLTRKSKVLGSIPGLAT